MIRKITYTIARFATIIILGQTLFFKFSSSPESVYIFESIGVEPWGRWVVGVLELAACVLLIVPKTAWVGGLLSAVLMVGAVGIHLTSLGVEVRGDGGLLFYYALMALLCSMYVLFTNKEKMKVVLSNVLKK